MNNRLLLAAIEYIKKWNFSVIPIRKNKKPFISWTEFQTRRANVDEIREWWKRWPYANIGIVCGKISNICILKNARDIVNPDNLFRELQARLMRYGTRGALTDSGEYLRSGSFFNE